MVTELIDIYHKLDWSSKFDLDFLMYQKIICKNIELHKIPKPIIKQDITTFLKYQDLRESEEKNMKDSWSSSLLTEPGLEAMLVMEQAPHAYLQSAILTCS